MNNFFRIFVNKTLSVASLILLFPLFLIMIVLIKLSSPGPAFFRQIRVGKNRQEFQLIKFRTMFKNAEKSELLLTARSDKRITNIGRILRRTKLDELPELWNVLIGDMNLVGPRPEVARYIKYYKPEWESVFSVKPGITDLATLQFRDEENVLEGAIDCEQAYIDVVLPLKMKLAIEYVDRRSLWLDFKILVLTVWAISFGRYIAKPDNHLAEMATHRIKSFNNRYSE